ncbi:MAG: helix-turn-helix transcriptional regulator [Clostridia bacterium]|nr:helix-turn-helix transcriptional regulator [Clostridia bacterium]
MQLCDINPFMRHAALQPSVLSSVPFCRAYDFRLFYIIEGRAKFFYLDRVANVSAGAIIYFRPDTPYYFDGNVKVIVLNFDMTRNKSDQKKAINPLDSLNHFDPSLIFENDPPSELAQPIIAEGAFEQESKFQKCLSLFSFPTPFSDAATSAIIKDVLCYMAQCMNEKTRAVPELVQRITLYIRQNYDKNIDNSNISAEFGYHSFYLNRIFKESTGITLHQAVILERLRIAKHLLRSTSLSINAIAAEAGFSERAQFCTVFRKHEGLTPTQYRNSNRQSDL